MQELTCQYFVSFGEDREVLFLIIVTTDLDFHNVMAKTSFIGQGIPNEVDTFDVYRIEETTRDRTPPNGRSPIWRITAIREPNKRYTM